MKRTLLLFASIIAMACSFTANAQNWTINLLQLQDGSQKEYVTTPPAAVTDAKIEMKNLWQITVGMAQMPFTWPETYLSGDEAKACISLTNQNGTSFSPSMVRGAGMNLFITFDPDLTTPGTYSLTIKEGIAQIAGKGSPAKTFTNLFVIPGETPVDPGTGEDPEPPVVTKDWYEDYTVSIDGGDVKFSFPNLGDNTLVQECEPYTVYEHVTLYAGGKEFAPYNAFLTNSDTEIVAYFTEDDIKDYSVADMIVKLDADVVSVDGVKNPELIWPEGAEIPSEPVTPEPPTTPEVTDLPWQLSAVGTLREGGDPAEASDWTNTYASDTEAIQEVSDISRVQVKIAKPDDMEFSDWLKIVYFTINSEVGKTVTVSNGTATYTPSSCADNGYITVSLLFDTPITEDGKYTVTIPEGLITFGDGTISPATVLTDCFGIKGDAVKLSFEPYEIDPASGSTVTASELNNITVKFPNACDILDDDQVIELNTKLYETVDNAISNIKLTLKGEATDEEDEEEEPTAVSYTASSLEVRDFDIVVSFAGQTIPAGEYTLTIPGMMFRNSVKTDVMNYPVIASYTVEETAEYNLTDYTFTPEPKVSVKEISTIAIAFKQPVKVMDDAVNEGIFSGIALVSATDEYLCTDMAFEDSENPTTLVFTFDTITKVGTYTLTIPAGFFAIDVPGVPEGASEEIKAEFVVSNNDSVAELLGEADAYTVSDLAGRVILRDAEKAALAGLEPGIYVINGKKVIIRK